MKRRRRALPALLLLAASWPPLAWGAARWLVVEAPLARADAILVLGGSSAYAERAALAATLYREGRAPLVLLSDDGERGGWSQEQQRNPFFVERSAWALGAAGVPASAVERLPRATASTYEEALLLREQAAARGLRSLLVVTSGYHSRRALWTFERVLGGSGVRVGVAPAAPGAQTPAPASWWLSAAGWRAVALEYPKLVYYRLRYRR
ncbi:MAG TPA: YdcF family protein [Pyrinomonadaceae bacterium]